jgi:hypothetical protein
MTRNTKLIAVTAAVVLAGGGAAIAAVELAGGSSQSAQALPAPSSFGDGNGLGTGGGDLGGGRYGDGGGGIRPGGGFGGRPGGGFFNSLGAAATYLGVSSAALQSDLQNGQTLAQVAKAQGKPTAGLIAALVAAQKKQLDAAVSSGQLTQPQEQQIEPFLAQRVKDLVDGSRPRFGRGFGGGDDGGGSGNGGGTGSFGSSTA